LASQAADDAASDPASSADYVMILEFVHLSDLTTQTEGIDHPGLYNCFDDLRQAI
jgi:hypothetical protein